VGWWERHVVPRVVDKSLGTEEVRALRDETCAGLQGRVLEVGFGSGLNVGHYPEAVTAIAAVEPNDTAWRMAGPRIDRSTVPVGRAGLDGQALDAEDDSFDAVLLTFVLCTIPDQRAALAEAFRALRPGGRVHFVEHGLAPEPRVQQWQHRLEPAQRRFGGGCHLTRDPAEDLRSTGFEVLDLDTWYLPGPAFTRPFTYVYRGTAEKAG
jgi:ubiquinone/menaquinone biosynthesis C-methylase UbiE